MNTALITWSCIVGLFALAVVLRFISALRFCAKGKHRIIAFGTERENLFIPGDPDPRKADDYDCEDFDDL